MSDHLSNISTSQAPRPLSKESRQRIQDEINALRIGLFAYRDQLQDGRHHDAAMTFQLLNTRLRRLSSEEFFKD